MSTQEFIADFHIHSRFSRATSKDLDVRSLDETAAKKGVDVLGTGDFTHPLWMAELESELEESSCEGLYVRKNDSHGTHFMLTVEISSIYSKNDSVRRVHTLVFAPSLEVAKQINAKLRIIGNLSSDGRPILGLDVRNLAEIVLEIDERCMVVPAHIWTPWFSVFGSKSGFDSLEEAFEDMTPYIFAVETGLSSDPPMNWRIKELDSVALLSNSDCHSASKIMREANVFSCEMSYGAVRDVLRTKDTTKFVRTLEFFPEEGKYHYDGHRACNNRIDPIKTQSTLCSVCGKEATLGVLRRVEALASRPHGEEPENIVPYTSIIPLEEIIASAVGVGVKSKKVQETYESLLYSCKTEIAVLLNESIDTIHKIAGERVAEGVRRMRENDVVIDAGYDGEFGVVRVFPSEHQKETAPTLF